MIKLICDTVIVYFYLIFVIRLMGKRQLGELQLSELITTILLSEIAAASITNPDIPIWHALLSVAIIVVFEIIVPLLMSRFSFLKRVFESKPSYLIFKGELSQKELKRNRLTIEEVIASLHSSNVSDINELEYLILEPNGKLSTFPKTDSKNVTIGDLKLSVKNKGIAHPLVIDGRLCKTGLERLGIGDELIKDILSRYSLRTKDIFLLTIDDCGELNYILKTKKPDTDKKTP